MKTLKIILFLALIIAFYASCTEQDLNEDDVLIENSQFENSQTESTTIYTGGGIND